MAERTLLWTVADPRGLSISLAADVWEDILLKHEDIRPYLGEIRQTVESPDEIYFDSTSTRNRTTGAQMLVYRRSFVLRGLLADKHLLVAVKVVIENDDERGYVETAYASRRIQKRLVPRWKK